MSIAVTVIEQPIHLTVTDGVTQTISIPSVSQINISLGTVAAGIGVPPGGTTGQVLAKKTNTAYDTEWKTGGAGGGSWGDIEGNIDDQIDLAGRLNILCSTGINSGGVLSINSPDDSKFKISAGRGRFVKTSGATVTFTERVWDELIVDGDMTHGSARISLHVIMDEGGVITQVVNKVDIDQYQDYIHFGIVAVVAATNKVAAVYDFQSIAAQPSLRLRQMLYALGSFSIKEGDHVFSANGANLKLNISAGEIIRDGANYGINPKTPDITETAAVDSITFFQPYHSGGVWTYAAVPSPFIDPDYYDNLTDKVPVPTGKWTIKPIYYYPSARFIQYGQAYFDSKQEAINHITDTIQRHPILMEQDFSKRGYVVVKQGATSLADPEMGVVIEAGKYGIGIRGAPVGILSVNGELGPAVTMDASDIAETVDRNYVTDNQASALDAANVPGPANAFATMLDIPSIAEDEIQEAASAVAEAAAFTAGAKIVIRTDLL
jgi:hypothetical protein